MVAPAIPIGIFVLEKLGEAAVIAGPWILRALAIGVGAKATSDVINEISQAEEDAKAKEKAGTATDTCSDCPCHKTVVVSKSAHPESAQHILDAQAAGKPKTLTIERSGAAFRRRASTGGFPRETGKQPDEYPPAMFLEGGAGASVRNIAAADNMGAGASIGNQLRGAPDGCKATITVGP